MRIDLHIHSIYSDGCSTPEEITSRAKALGFDGFAITDHDSINGWLRAKKAARELGLIFVAGKEIVIREKHGEKKGKKYGEILALFLEEDIKIKQTPENINEIIDSIHDQDGIAAIPHPFGDYARIQKLTEYAIKNKIKIDAIETINGRCSMELNSKSIELAAKYKSAQIGGSDAHHLREIGTAYTFAEADSEEEFRKAIKKKLTKAIGIPKTEREIGYNRLVCRINRFLNFKK